jgi:peroxiredoxin Q/BCP
MKLTSRVKSLFVMTALFSTLMSFVSGAEPLAIGATAPAISGTNQDGKTVDLGALYKTGYVLVYFYPKAGTPGCTAEACSLRDAFATLTSANLTVVGVSHDSVAAQKKFATDQKVPFDLLADTEGKIYNAFGVPGIANRQSFLTKDGKVIWRELQASTAEQAADVTKALAAAKAGQDPMAATAAPTKPATTAPVTSAKTAPAAPASTTPVAKPVPSSSASTTN